jgi:hypothetical protein
MTQFAATLTHLTRPAPPKPANPRQSLINLTRRPFHRIVLA